MQLSKIKKGSEKMANNFMLRGFLILLVSIILVSATAVFANNGETESWPTFQYDYQRTGAPDNTGPKTNDLVWKWFSGKVTEYPEGTFPESTALVPAVVNGKVYVGTEENRFVALDEFTGELIWEYQTEGIVRTPPTVADGKVFFGSHDSYFYALDADTGELVWKHGPVDEAEFDVGIWTIGTVFANGLAVFGAEDVYALNADTGALVWRKDFAGGYDWALGVASIGNTLLVPSLDTHLYALKIDTGEQLWKYKTDSYIESLPATAYGNVYVGSTDNHTYCVDLNTGEHLWKIEHGWSDKYGFGGGGWSHPAIHNNRVFTAGTNGDLLALDAEEGNIIWSYSTGELTFGGVAVVDGVVYGGSYTNKFYAVNEDTGTLIWEFETNGPINGAPAIVDGMLIWGSSDGYVYAIGEPILPHEEIPIEYIYAAAAIVILAVVVIVGYVYVKRR